MLKPLFEIDFGNIPIYFMMMLLGFIVAFITLDRSLKKKNYSIYMSKKVETSLFGGALAGVLSANIANWFLFDGMLGNALFVRLTEGGFSFIFGLVVFLIVSAILLRLNRVNVSETMELAVRPVLIAHFFGRIGCILRGCCWGKSIWIGGTEYMLPAREIEAVWLLILFFIIPVIAKKVEKKQLWIYLLGYSSLRFFLEFLRGDDRGCLFGITWLSPSQIMCILLLIVSMVKLFPEQILCKFKLEELYAKWEKKTEYISLPVDCTETEAKEFLSSSSSRLVRKPILKSTTKKIIGGVIIGGMVLVALFTINPLNLGWCSDLKWKVTSWFSELFADSSKQEVIGDSSGTAILPVDQEGSVDLESGLEIISEIDNWSGAQYVPVSEVELASGGSAYYYLQYLNEKPVLETARILITDDNDEAQYLLADASNQAFTTEITEEYKTQGVSFETMKDQVEITESMSCWYDCGSGLVAAKHVILSVDGQEPVMGVLLQESNDQIICFTGPELGIISNGENYNVLSQGEEVAIQLTDKYGVEEEVVNKIFASIKQIVHLQGGMNEKRFGEVFIAQLRIVLEKAGYEEGTINKVCQKVADYFDSTEDEKAIKIQAEPKKSRFVYKIDYYFDEDVINIENLTGNRMQVTVETEQPVRVEVYDRDGHALTSIYIEKEETISLYPEDGTNFIFRVKGCEIDNKRAGGNYYITVNAEEQRVNIPITVASTLYRIQDAYNTSNLTAFMTMYQAEGYSMEEGLVMSAFAPFMDSCAANNGNKTDIAKEMMASYILNEAYDSKISDALYNSEMTVTYDSHIKTEEGYLVKANVRILNGELLVYNGYTRFNLQPMEEGAIPQELLEIEALAELLKSSYCITAMNTVELYQAFGDDPATTGLASDIVSLYEFCDNAIDARWKEEVIIQIVYREDALKAGHSQEKVDAFIAYIERANISQYKQKRDELKNEIVKLRSVKTMYDIYSLITDSAELVDQGFAETLGFDSEFYKLLKHLYELRTKPIIFLKDTITDAVKDQLVEDLTKDLMNEADELEELVKELDMVITDLEAKYGEGSDNDKE